MTEEQKKKLAALDKTKQDYLITEGINTECKEGEAQKKFNELFQASGECWNEVHSEDATPEERNEFKEELKKRINI